MAYCIHWQCVWANCWFQKFIVISALKNKIITEIFCSSPHSCLLMRVKFALPCTSLELA